jgi:hypothetical protein
MSLFDWFRKKRVPHPRPVPRAIARPVVAAPRATPSPGGPMGARDKAEGFLLYALQFVVLPEAVFQNHPELIRELGGERSVLPLLYFRMKARLQCARAGVMTPPELDGGAGQKADSAFFEAVSIHSHRRNGFTVHLMTMPTPVESPEAYFVAIVHRDDEPKEHGGASPSTCYFTLEKSDAGGTVLGGCERDGTHLNFGAGPEPAEDAFLAEVFRRVGI